jgi:uncharacterized protein
LKLPRCGQCRAFTLPPDIVCPHCKSAEPAYGYEPVSGRGKVRTWTVVRHSFLQGFELPFVLVDVELDDQPDLRMVGRLLGDADAPLFLGERVEVAFEELVPGVAIPSFRREARP